jgi:hypothetical protein
MTPSLSNEHANCPTIQTAWRGAVTAPAGESHRGSTIGDWLNRIERVDKHSGLMSIRAAMTHFSKPIEPPFAQLIAHAIDWAMRQLGSSKYRS